MECDVHDVRWTRRALRGLRHLVRVRSPQTWQVPRDRFDELLLRHAAACGADVRERHRVIDIGFEPDGVAVICRPVLAEGDMADGLGPSHRIRGRVLVDASGRASLLSHRFDLRVDEPNLRNIAILSHHANVPRGEGRRAGDIRVVARADDGWFWLIPITAELTSVGVVLPRHVFQAHPRLDHGELPERLIADTPAVASLMREGGSTLAR